MSIVARLIVAVCAFVISATLQAQVYPSRPVKIIVPYPPGGANDLLGRIMSERLQKALGQPFLVENRSGAGGLIGVEMAAKAAPDGYTLLVSASGPLAVGLGLYKSVPYNVMRDFAPVAMIAEDTMVLVSAPGFKPQNVKELIAYAKANPGMVKAALASLGSMHHLMTELFRMQTGTEINMIPYKGSGPAVAALVGGHVDIDFDNLSAVISHIKSSRLRALAVATPQRSELLPEVPTFNELGLTELVAAPWFAMVAPAGTPKEIVVRLNEKANAILREPEVKALLAKYGENPVIRTPEQMGTFIQHEIERWAKVVKDSGAKVE